MRFVRNVIHGGFVAESGIVLHQWDRIPGVFKLVFGDLFDPVQNFRRLLTEKNIIFLPPVLTFIFFMLFLGN